MADDKEPELFADPRQAPPREVTRLSPLVRRLDRAERLALHLQRHLHLHSRAAARSRSSIRARTIDSAPRRDSRRDRGRDDRDDPRHPHPSRPQRARRPAEARRPARASSGRRRSRRRATGPAASTRRTTAPTRPTPSSPTANASRGAGSRLEAVATPGHCANHLCFALLRGRGAVLRRPRHGLVDLGRRSARRLDGRLHGVARQGAGARRAHRTGPATAGRWPSRSATCGRSPITAASARPRFSPRSATASQRSRNWWRGSMSASIRSSRAPRACRPSPISRIFANAGKWSRSRRTARRGSGASEPRLPPLCLASPLILR